MNADPIVLEPGSVEWQREMTASKVSAVLGLSPWQSRFALWYAMAGAVDPGPQTPQQERGHYLEPVVAQWVADQYGLELFPGRCWRSRVRPWQVASPDRLAFARGPRGTTQVDAVVEAKTDANGRFVWGKDGSDEVPPHYRAQVVWQCDTLGVDVGYVGVLLERLEFRGYVIRPEPGEAEFIRAEARAFLDSLAAGDPPDVDAHHTTYETLRAIHPQINGGTVPVAWEDAHAYAASVIAFREAEDRYNLERSRLAALMGDAAKAECGGVTLAYRTPAPGTRVPYVAATRSKAALAAFAADPPPQEEPDDQA